MLADEREVGKFMIEVVLIEPDNIGIAALMICMAIGAGRATRMSILAMEPLAAIDIAGNFLVTVKAQITLPGTFEFQVAIAAVLFELGMRFHEFAGHDERLDLAKGGSGYGQEQKHQQSA